MAGGIMDDDFEAKVEAELARTAKPKAKAFAIKNTKTGELDLRTVMDRPVGAMVNWLYTNGISLMTRLDQPWIDRFNEVRVLADVDVVEVEITEVVP